MFLDNLGNNLPVSGNGADGGLVILAHESAVTFDISTEDRGELTFEVFCCHADISFKRWKGQANKSREFEQGKGKSGSGI
jgi:hypothetical protein